VIREGLPCSTCSCSPRAHNTPRISRTHLRPRWTDMQHLQLFTTRP
jgi:hypothetical protein